MDTLSLIFLLNNITNAWQRELINFKSSEGENLKLNKGMDNIIGLKIIVSSILIRS